MNFKTNRQFTPPRIRNHTPQTVSTAGFDESRTDSRVVSYRTSQERSQDRTLKQIKDIVVNKLHTIVSQETRDDYRQCLEKIRYISPQKLADILIQTEQRSPQQVTTYSSNQQSSCSRNGSTYVEIFQKRNKRTPQTTQEKSPNVSAYQTNKTGENKSKEKEQQVQPKLDSDAVINHLARRSEYQAVLMEIDKKKQELVELDLQVLQMQIDVRGYNNKTLQLNWEHQDEIVNLENKVKKLQETVTKKEERYTDLIVELDKQKKIEDEFQETFNMIMQDINQLKRVKKQHSNPQNDDEQTIKLNQLMEENKQIQTQINDMKAEQVKTKNLTGMIDLKNKQSLHVKVLQKDMNSIAKKKEQILKDIESIRISLQEEVIIPSNEMILKNLDEELEIAKQKLASSKIQYESTISNQQEDKRKQEETLKKQYETVSNMKKQLDDLRINEEEQQLKKVKDLETLKSKLLFMQEQYDQQLSTYKREDQNYILEEQNNRKEIELAQVEIKELEGKRIKQDETSQRLKLENQELSLRIQNQNSSQKDGMIKLEKLNQQLEVLEKQVKDRQTQKQEQILEINRTKEALSQLEAQDFTEENRLLQEILKENQSKRAEVQELEELLNEVSQSVNEEEIFQLKQRKQIESKMLKMNELGENEQTLINRIRVLEAQLKK